MHYSSVIIGFGKAGKTLAAFLARKGERVALIEQSATMYGGTCINIGCIPGKTLVHDAQSGVPFAQAAQRKEDVVTLLRQKNYQMLADLTNVTLIDGQAAFIDAHQLRVVEPSGERVISADRFFINTGAQANLPPIPGLTQTPRVYDSVGLMQLKTLPPRLTILGAGYIGVEFASMFRQFGAQVTLLEILPVFLPAEDRDIADEVAKVLQDAGIALHLNVAVERISADNHDVLAHYAGQTLRADALLVACSRTPNTKALALDKAGVKVNERGAIVVDNYLRTSQPHIWALGDVNGGPQFTYISLDDFRIVRDQLYGTGQRHSGDRQSIPYAVFMTPPLARVGLSEQQALARGESIKVARLPVAAIPRARTLNDTRGLLKVVVQADSGQILGASLFCAGAYELINLIKLAMDAGLPYSILRDQIYTHPTMSEAFNDLFAQLD